jgi:hypothetical protein
MGLTDQIAATRAGVGVPAALVGELRRTAVLVPVADGGLWSAVRDGIRWIYAFTSEASLARFALARGAAPDVAWPYQRVLGARLLDVVVSAAGGPCGVAVDVADRDGSMFFPPVVGVVPESVAVDLRDAVAGGAGAGVGAV